ncbi:MAG: class I SAM-dependent methyltransferase [Parashewanella sp.]
MKLNQFEKSVVGHPFRFWVQNYIEMPLLKSLFDNVPLDTGMALEIGCGYGNGIRLIREHFHPEYITAIDYDFDMVHAAKSRYIDDVRVAATQADATLLPFPDNQFDLVFNFAVFHHIPKWQKAIEEVHRVLKPNGFLLIEDLYRTAITNPLSNSMFEHPQHNRFDHQELIAQLNMNGFRVQKEKNLLNLAGIALAQKV